MMTKRLICLGGLCVLGGLWWYTTYDEEIKLVCAFENNVIVCRE